MSVPGAGTRRRPSIQSENGTLVKIFRNRLPLVIAAASLVALSACEADSSGSETVAEGTVAFSYAGADAGSYNATGRFNRLRPDQGTFAVGGMGELETGDEGLVVYARSVRSDQLADEFLLSVENPELGTYTCAADDATCTFGAFFILGADDTGNAQSIYTSVAGTVTITSINEDRARGTFTFQFEGFDLSEDPQTVQVTSGTFDVPLVPATS